MDRTLGDLGPITISEVAVESYARMARAVWEDADVLPLETARAELAQLAAAAVYQRPAKTPSDEWWRYRSRKIGIDLSLYVRRAADGCTVLSIKVHPYAEASGRNRENRRRR